MPPSPQAKPFPRPSGPLPKRGWGWLSPRKGPPFRGFGFGAQRSPRPKDCAEGACPRVDQRSKWRAEVREPCVYGYLQGNAGGEPCPGAPRACNAPEHPWHMRM